MRSCLDILNLPPYWLKICVVRAVAFSFIAVAIEQSAAQHSDE